MVNKTCAGIIAVLLLTGCGKKVICEPIIKEIVVKVPVIKSCPKIEMLPHSQLPILNLKQQDTIKTTAEKYYLSIILLQNRVKELEHAINIYNLTTTVD